eukprot:Opistho-2@78106
MSRVATVAVAFVALCALALATPAASSTADSANVNSVVKLGVEDPPAHYQRYRRELYPSNRAFFQWWYFWIRDEQTDTHWAFDYQAAVCGTGDTKDGPCAGDTADSAVIMFSSVDASKGNLVKYERYPMDRFASAAPSSASNSVDTSNPFFVRIATDDDANTNETTFSIEAISDSEYRVRGHMRPSAVANVWHCDGCGGDSALEISWDLVIRRVRGWYGQDNIEIPDRIVGIIQWNTYAHLSVVDGTITIAGRDPIVLSSQGKRFRAYADMNWGVDFPHPPASAPASKAIGYAWGWYYAGKASENPSDDISVIAGTGLTYEGITFGSMEGCFADIRLGDTIGVNVHATRVTVWEGSVLEKSVGFASDGSSVVGVLPAKLLRFEVDRSNWTDVTDAHGSASIPLRQIVTIESEAHLITMDFTSELRSYNRLLFPRQGYVFSDFEALGATAAVRIVDKTSGNTLAEFTTNAGGLEYGYNIPTAIAHADDTSDGAITVDADASTVIGSSAKATKPTAIVLGGGIGGLTAAHELIERGFDVTVYERLDQFGGKARSFGAVGTGKDGRKDLPAEHGFRIFAGEYGATRNTMSRIPLDDTSSREGGRTVWDSVKAAPKTVVDHMTEGTEAFFASANNGTTFSIPSGFPKSIKDAEKTIKYIKEMSTYLTEDEIAEFGSRLWVILTSSMERRFHEFENVSWWDFMRTENYSAHYGDIVKMISGNILAADPRRGSAHVVGHLAEDLVTRTVVPGQKGILYMLDGPTSDVWIDPWTRHLTKLGVKLVSGRTLVQLQVDHSTGKLSGALLMDNAGNKEVVSGDVYVAALPAEKMSVVLDEDVKRLAPRLANVDKLETAWMVGVQYFLRRDVPVVNGNIGFLHSPWALAGVSQTQFRPSLNLSEYGDGTVKGVLSITISNWTTPGLYVCKTPALQCSRDQVISETWAQIKAWLPDLFTDDDLVASYMDPGVTFNADGTVDNYSPLLINTPNSWWNRPTPSPALGEIPNLFIAADYAQAPQNVACMETASEAARLSVNGILDYMGLPATNYPRCTLWPAEADHLGEGFTATLLAPFRAEDELLFKLNKPHAGCKCAACMCPGDGDGLPDAAKAIF